VTPRVPRGPDLFEKPHGRELGIGLESRSDQRLVGGRAGSASAARGP
jgi:hypothetical protein